MNFGSLGGYLYKRLMLPPEYQYQFPHSKRLKLPKLKRIKLEYISQNDLVSTWSFKSFASDSPSLSKISRGFLLSPQKHYRYHNQVWSIPSCWSCRLSEKSNQYHEPVFICTSENLIVLRFKFSSHSWSYTNFQENDKIPGFCSSKIGQQTDLQKWEVFCWEDTHKYGYTFF